jgi:hypothetical protein
MYHVVYIVRKIWFVILIMFMGDHPDLQLIFHLSTTFAMVMYIGYWRPFKKWEYNIYELVNEFTIFGLTVI